MASGEYSENAVEVVSKSAEDDLMDQATVFDNINYMGRAVIGELFILIKNDILDTKPFYYLLNENSDPFAYCPDCIIQIIILELWPSCLSGIKLIG